MPPDGLRATDAWACGIDEVDARTIQGRSPSLDNIAKSFGT
jgi:hypothetical protein